jgi:hypothetical protein
MLEDFHIATTNQIHRLFFPDTSYRYVAKRLEYLSSQGYIKRAKSTIDNCFAYYSDKKPVQVHHDLIRSELYSHMKTKLNMLEWHNEFVIEDIRPDALTYIDDNGIVFPVLIEVHLSNKFNFDKYISLVQKNDLKAIFGLMPRVIICTDREVTISKNIGLKFKVVGFDMSGLESLFK